MPTYLYRCPTIHGFFDVTKPMVEAGRAEVCPDCRDQWERWGGDVYPYQGPLAIRVYTPQRLIMRPSGYRLKPGDKGFDDFRREMELGEIRDDPSPVRLSPEEIARFDDAPIDIPPDPERDRALHQLVAQHWTEDLSDDTVRRRELAMNAAKPHPTT